MNELKELAEKILDIVGRKSPRLQPTEEDLAEWISNDRDASYKSRVNNACRWLVSEGRLKREGEGVANCPFWYRLTPRPFNRRF